MINKFFKTAFGSGGELTAVPDAVQVDGSISFAQGWGVDYQRDQATDPLAKNIDRRTMNSLLNQITSNIGTWQTQAWPEWIAAADNGGAAYSYAKGTRVRNAGVTYESMVDANTALLSDATKWRSYGVPMTVRPTIAAGVDLDDVIITGLYDQPVTANVTLPLNYPAAANPGALSVYTATNMTFQEFVTYSPTRVFHRRLYAAVWSSWIEVAQLGGAAFAGPVTAPSPAQFDNDTSVATSAWVNALGVQYGTYGTIATSTLTLSAAHAGRILQVDAVTTITVPLANSVMSGVTFNLLITDVAKLPVLSRSGTNTFRTGSGAATSLVPRATGLLTLISNGVGEWIVSGEAAVEFSTAFSALFGASGYQKFPSGLILQWGTTAALAPNASAVMTFPISFPNSAFGAVFGVFGPTAGTAEYTAISQFSVTVANGLVGSATNPIFYLALGR